MGRMGYRRVDVAGMSVEILINTARLRIRLPERASKFSLLDERVGFGGAQKSELKPFNFYLTY